MTKVAIIGAGQIGSRHLQGVCQSPDVSEIFVYDPSPASLDIAKQRVADIKNLNIVKNIKFLNSISDLANIHFQVGIFASSANFRAASIREFFNLATCSHAVLEKFLFCERADYLEIGKLLSERTKSAWVNCPRRTYKFYSELKEELSGSDSPITMNVLGGEWGLACNSIHFLDVFSYLTNESGVKICSSSFDETVLKSKRVGFYELTGTLIARTPKGDKLILHSSPGVTGPLVLNIQTKNELYFVCEALGSCQVLPQNSLRSFKFPFQSEISGNFVSSLIRDGVCSLSTYKNSATLHLELFDVFSKALAPKGLATPEYCPIT